MLLGFGTCRIVPESQCLLLLAGASPSCLLGFWVALHLFPDPCISPSWCRTHGHGCCPPLGIPRAQRSPGSRDPVQVLESQCSLLGREEVVTW